MLEIHHSGCEPLIYDMIYNYYVWNMILLMSCHAMQYDIIMIQKEKMCVCVRARVWVCLVCPHKKHDLKHTEIKSAHRLPGVSHGAWSINIEDSIDLLSTGGRLGIVSKPCGALPVWQPTDRGAVFEFQLQSHSPVSPEQQHHQDHKPVCSHKII